jgi:hypothetical protein
MLRISFLAKGRYGDVLPILGGHRRKAHRKSVGEDKKKIRKAPGAHWIPWPSPLTFLLLSDNSPRRARRTHNAPIEIRQ